MTTGIPHVPITAHDLEPRDVPEITDEEIQQATARLCLDRDECNRIHLYFATRSGWGRRVAEQEQVLEQLAFAITGEDVLDHGKELRERIRQLLREERA